MYLQTDSRIAHRNWNIRTFGCYYMVLLHIAEKFTGVEPSPSDIAIKFYWNLIDSGYMDEECTILNPVQILHYLGFKEVGLVKYSNADYQPDSQELEVLKFEYDPDPDTHWEHFVAGCGHGHVAWDPWGVSQTATKGTLVSKRIFRLL